VKNRVEVVKIECFSRLCTPLGESEVADDVESKVVGQATGTSEDALKGEGEIALKVTGE
jgi:hypothetical protein